MNIAISGASGFIGSALFGFLKDKGHIVVPLGRKYFIDGSDLLYNELSSCDVIINLAGAPINKRWTNKYKKEIIQSRVNITRKIVNTIAQLQNKPQLFISASAIGCYPLNKESDEDSPTDSTSFLAQVCKEWEQETMKSDVERTVICRFGVVLSPHGGALEQMLIPFRFRTEVKFSSGNIPFPWISLSDLIEIIYLIINNNNVSGILNCVAPEIISYNKIIDKIKHAKHAIFTVSIHDYIKDIIFGEMGSMITGGQKVVSKKLKETGFTFQYPTIDSFIKQNIPL